MSKRRLQVSCLIAAAALVLPACSGSGGQGGAGQQAAPQARATGARAQGAPSGGTHDTFKGGNAIRRSEVPYETLLAEARRTGRPAVLFFWTSW